MARFYLDEVPLYELADFKESSRDARLAFAGERLYVALPEKGMAGAALKTPEEAVRIGAQLLLLGEQLRRHNDEVFADGIAQGRAVVEARGLIDRG